MSDEFKALEEVAKTTGKAIDAGKQFGSFISKFISGSLEQGLGIFEDKLKYMRWERQIRLMQKANEYMESIGISVPNKAIELKYAIPLFQAATLEDNDYLQDLWAKLLVNASYKESGIQLCRTYIDILERLSSLEAQILMVIYELPFEEIEHKGVITTGLPDVAIPYNEQDRKEYHLENEAVLFALANLSRLGCLSVGRIICGGQHFEKVNPTLLGKKFVASCTIKLK